MLSWSPSIVSVTGMFAVPMSGMPSGVVCSVLLNRAPAVRVIRIGGHSRIVGGTVGLQPCDRSARVADVAGRGRRREVLKEEVGDGVGELLRDELTELRRLHRPHQGHATLDAQPFVRPEEEGLVLDDRTADRSAELVEIQRVDVRAREHRSRVQRVVAQELVRRTVEAVRSSFGHDVDDRGAVPSELGGEVVRRDAELLNHVDIGVDRHASRGELIVVVGAVEQEVVGAVPLAVDERRIAAGGSAEHDVAWIARGAGLQLHQLQHVASVQRQLADTLLVDESSRCGLLRC